MSNIKIKTLENIKIFIIKQLKHYKEVKNDVAISLCQEIIEEIDKDIDEATNG